MAISASALVSYYTWIPAGSDVTHEVAAAARIRADVLEGNGIDSATLDEIEWQLATHFAALRFEGGRLVSDKVADMASSYGGKYDAGLRATLYGQQAISMDTSGALSQIDVTPATIDFL